jgi:hypothetical protein
VICDMAGRQESRTCRKAGPVRARRRKSSRLFGLAAFGEGRLLAVVRYSAPLVPEFPGKLGEFVGALFQARIFPDAGSFSGQDVASG